ncbi:MAG: lysine--tRNA ligase [Blastocatellia bacterium]|nr:lysine--tRNA ligase [Blastocatellia bacterium]
MSTIPIIELRNIRLSKIESLREKGINPYPSTCARTHYARAILGDYEGHEGKTVTIAGRLMSWRSHGALSFGHIQDQTGRIQLYLRKEELKPTNATDGNLGYDDLGLLDVGDFVEATGIVTRTKRGEISVLPETLRLLTKSLRPLPDKWAGLKDREAVLRRRYLDTTITPDHKAPFEAYSRMLYAIRAFLDERGFLEFNTPVLQPQYGGGTAKPFITHVNALGCDMYLAISHELYLKRLIAAGFDKVYTIGRYFRNEGIDRSHHPEFSMVETMTAYENYEYNMDLIEDMFRHIAETVFGKTVFSVRGHEIDFGKPWKRISMSDAVLGVTGIDFRKSDSVEQANAHLSALGIKEPQESRGLALAKAFEVKVEPTLINPTFIFGHPMDISPLAKPMDADPDYAERFEIFIAGMECGDNWSEQNDPVALLERWKSAYKPQDAHAGEFHPLDYDFVEVLEHGIPPTTGIGPGIERMAMIFTGEENIDNVIFFPIMRPVLSPTNAAIYSIDSLPGEERRTGDVLLTMDEFQSLVTEGILLPETSEITIRPYLRIWDRPSSKGHWKASGHIDIQGLLLNRRLRIAGYAVERSEKPDKVEAARKYIEHIERVFNNLAREHFSGCKLHIDETVHDE